jgi:hypothetical protein
MFDGLYTRHEWRNQDRPLTGHHVLLASQIVGNSK